MFLVSASWMMRKTVVSNSGDSLGKSDGWRSIEVSMPLRFVKPVQVPLQRGLQTHFIQQRRMQEMRYAADLLDGTFNQHARFRRTDSV